MNNEDRRLGMNRDISRRDFLEGSLQFAGGLAAASAMPALGKTGARIGMPGQPLAAAGYPPSRPGLRGSHDGSFEVAHQLAWEGRSSWGTQEPDPDVYDLVVVGAGVSGLSAAYFYQEQHPDARILILDNHDDFGGHAKRNEFSHGDRTILGYGGSQSFEAPSAYSDVAKSLLDKLGVDMEKLAGSYDQEFYRRNDLGSVIHFDRENYGRDATLRASLANLSMFLPLAENPASTRDIVADMPLSENARVELRRLLSLDDDFLPDHSIFAEPDYLGSLSYEELLSRHFEITEPEVFSLLKHLGSSYYGYGTEMVPAIYALALGLPGLGGTSLGTFEGLLRTVGNWLTEPYIFHFPDGNASVPRLLVRRLIPGVASGNTMEDIVTAPFNYGQLDSAGSPVRLRLRSTVVNVSHNGNPASTGDVSVSYVRDGNTKVVRAKKVVLACYNMAIPHLCPELPEEQKEALAQLVKIPMMSINILLSNWHAVQKVGMGYAYSPGRWNKTLLVDFPVSMQGYQFAETPDDPIMLTSLRGVTGAGETPEDQSRAGRYELLAMQFEDYEREIRRHLAGMLGPAGFDPAADIAGITVNRWPHGYAWEANPLFSPDYAEGEYPQEVGRKPFGHIAIANSDAGARAYLDCAIDEAWRAVNEIS